MTRVRMALGLFEPDGSWQAALSLREGVLPSFAVTSP
jgi:hypothetical protein